VFGLEDLTSENIFNIPHLFINKMMPGYDFGVIKCWHKKLKERQKIKSERKLNLEYYKNWPQVSSFFNFKKLKKFFFNFADNL